MLLLRRACPSHHLNAITVRWVGYETMWTCNSLRSGVCWVADNILPIACTRQPTTEQNCGWIFLPARRQKYQLPTSSQRQSNSCLELERLPVKTRWGEPPAGQCLQEREAKCYKSCWDKDFHCPVDQKLTANFNWSPDFGCPGPLHLHTCVESKLHEYLMQVICTAISVVKAWKLSFVWKG